jgi:hypothetical protein
MAVRDPVGRRPCALRSASSPPSDRPARARAVLGRFRAEYLVQRTPGRVAFLIDNPRGLSGDEHPFASRLPTALERSDVATIAFRAP